MGIRRTRLRTIHVAELDRQLAEAQAIGRAIDSGARWARVRSCERIAAPGGDGNVWEIVIAVPRRRR